MIKSGIQFRSKAAGFAKYFGEQCLWPDSLFISATIANKKKYRTVAQQVSFKPTARYSFIVMISWLFYSSIPLPIQK
jgi:hypothetical protein